jgi:uroporphyrinogen III methyltransferase / synthase
VIVGAVVARRDALSWFEEKPLFGRRIVVTRPEGESDRSAAVLEELGAEVLLAPTVVIRPVDDPGPMDRAIGRLDEFDWLVFTSSNGVTHFLDRLLTLGRDLRALGRVKLAAIGPATAEALSRYRLRADLVPDSYRSEALAESLLSESRGRRILLARADRGRTLLKDELGRVAQVEQVAVYRNSDALSLPPDVARRIGEGSVDWITLTSSAITARLHALLDEAGLARVGRTIRLASISPVTTAAARRVGWEVVAEAMEYTWDGVVAAILGAEASRGGG